MGLDLLVEFEFRTTRTTGVLLGISSQKMDGLGIEMIDEKVSGRSPDTAHPFSSLFRSCQFLHCWVITIHVALLSRASCSPACTFNVSVHTTVVLTNCGPSVCGYSGLSAYSKDIRSLCSPILQNY